MPKMSEMPPNSGGFVFRVCLHFAAQPDALLTTSQIAKMHGRQNKEVAWTLRRAVEGGWLSTDPGQKGGLATEYTAGPEILKLHGRAT